MILSSEETSAQLLEVASSLRHAEEARLGIAPPSALVPGLSLDDAYRIQQLNIAQRLTDGERTVGHKIGLTSLAMQRQLGVDQPDYGILTDRMVIDHEGDFDSAELLAPRVEAEFAFRIGVDLHPSPTLNEVTAAVDGIGVALEIIDSRVADWKISLVDTVADNASSARVVWGPFVPANRQLLSELPDTVITLCRDGEEVGSGPGSAVLGDPLVSLHWLATAIGRYGEHFRAGDLVIAGAVAAAVPLLPGSIWEAHADGLPAVRFTSTTTNEDGEP